MDQNIKKKRGRKPKENKEYVNDNQIVRESIINLIFNSENIFYVGLWFIIISISLYVLGL